MTTKALGALIAAVGVLAGSVSGRRGRSASAPRSVTEKYKKVK